MNPVHRLHETLASSGAKAVIQNTAARDYGVESSRPARVRLAVAKLLETHVHVPKTSSEIFSDVLADLSHKYPAYVLPSSIEPESPTDTSPIVA